MNGPGYIRMRTESIRQGWRAQHSEPPVAGSSPWSQRGRGSAVVLRTLVVTIGILLSVWTSAAFGSPLSDLATSLQPGAFATLTTNNITAAFQASGASGNII